MSEKQQGGNNNRNQNNRQGGNRGGNRNNNRNRNNSNRNNQGGQNRNSNHQGGNNQGQSKKPAPQPLTFWQKFLSLFGIKPAQPQPQARTPQKKFTTDKAKSPQSANKSSSKPSSEKKPATKKARQPQKVEVTSSRLYVGNLSYETTEYDLEELFKGNGTVKGVEIIYNRQTHKSKGYGFIEMKNVDDAKNAVNVHHDQPFMGRNLIVNGAKTKQYEDKGENSQQPAA